MSAAYMSTVHITVHILVIEDGFNSRKLLLYISSAIGHKTSEAARADEVIR